MHNLQDEFDEICVPPVNIILLSNWSFLNKKEQENANEGI